MTNSLPKQYTIKPTAMQDMVALALWITSMPEAALNRTATKLITEQVQDRLRVKFILGLILSETLPDDAEVAEIEFHPAGDILQFHINICAEGKTVRVPIVVQA